MEENGYIKSQWDLENDRPRKVYSITHEGEELLSCTEDSLSHIYRKLEIGTGKIPFNGNNLSVKCLTNGKKDSRGHVGRATIQRF
jgi:DNA-binding PadR family transcriptional regulator